MHWIDPMHKEPAMGVFMDFCHSLLKLEKKMLWATLWRNKNVYHGGNLQKVDFKAVRIAFKYGLAWPIPL